MWTVDAMAGGIGWWLMLAVGLAGLSVMVAVRKRSLGNLLISVLIIAADDEICIEGVVRQLLNMDCQGRNCFYQPEIIVVNTGGQDQTAVILQRLQRLKPDLGIVEADPKHALSEGVAACHGHLILLLDLSRAGAAQTATLVKGLLSRPVA